MFPACFLTPEAALACRTVPQRLQRIVWAAQFAGMRSSCLQPGHRALSTSGMARSLTRMRKRRYLLSCCHLKLKQTEVQNLREGFRSVLFEARALRIGAEFQRDGIAVGALAPGGLHAPEVRHPCLVIRVALEVFAVNDHGLAAQIHATRTIRGSGIRHGSSWS